MSKLKRSPLDLPSLSGGYVYRERVRFAFFIRRPHLMISPDVLSILEELIYLFAPPRLSSIVVPSGDWFDFDLQGLIKEVRKRFKYQAINENISLSGDQSNIPDFSIDYEGTAIDRPIFREAASTLVFSIAASVFDEMKPSCLPLFAKIAQKLECSAAYVNLSLDDGQGRADSTNQTLAQRFRGLDISNVSCVARDIGDKLPGIFWKNYFTSSIVNALGGISVLEKGLSKHAHLQTLESGGLLVTLGAEPSLGDANEPENLLDWVWLARLAQQKGLLHVPTRVNYFDGYEDITGRQAQERWHLRFINLLPDSRF